MRTRTNPRAFWKSLVLALVLCFGIWAVFTLVFVAVTNPAILPFL